MELDRFTVFESDLIFTVIVHLPFRVVPGIKLKCIYKT